MQEFRTTPHLLVVEAQIDGTDSWEFDTFSEGVTSSTHMVNHRIDG
jgi:hypothetical protein